MNHKDVAHAYAMKLTKYAIDAPPKPIEAIRDDLGMRDHVAKALDNLEAFDKQTNLTLRTEHLTLALIHSNLARVETNLINRHTSEWAGMEGNES